MDTQIHQKQKKIRDKNVNLCNDFLVELKQIHRSNSNNNNNQTWCVGTCCKHKKGMLSSGNKSSKKNNKNKDKDNIIEDGKLNGDSDISDDENGLKSKVNQLSKLEKVLFGVVSGFCFMCN